RSLPFFLAITRPPTTAPHTLSLHDALPISDPSVPGFGPMAKYKDDKLIVHGMTHEDIQDVVRAFAQAAKDAKAIGCDAVELHGAHGYLIDQFFWEGTNQRDDEYGGNMENRGRFAVEIIRAVREAVGPDFPIIFRFSQW